MANDYIFESEEEKEARQKDAQALDVNALFNEIAESPEKLTQEIALEIYNDYPYKRDQIYTIYFKYIHTVDEWIEIYRNSKENHLSRQLAKKKIQECSEGKDYWVELYETTTDKFLQLISINNIKSQCKTLQDWMEVYKLASYGFETTELALVKMREVSKSYEDWKEVYEIAPFGSKTQLFALENLMLTARERQKEELEKQEETRKENILGFEDWRNNYKNERDFYSMNKDDALINLYLTADAS